MPVYNSCKLCDKLLNTNSSNYIINKKCNCKFHYECYNNYFPNYYSITVPKCPNCHEFYNKKDIDCCENINYEESYNTWIGNHYKFLFMCQEKNCIHLAYLKYFNYCEKHFWEKYNKYKVLNSIKFVGLQCLGLPPEKKYELLKSLL